MTEEKFAKIKETVKTGVMSTLKDDKALMWAGAIGLWQGLKYKGNLVNGLKGGLAVLGVLATINVLKLAGEKIESKGL